MEGVGLIILGVGIPIAAAIIKFVPVRQSVNGYVNKEVCRIQHENLDRRLQEMNNFLCEIDKKMDYLMAENRK